MEYLNILFAEVYKILFLLIPVLVSVAMIVWLDRRVWAFVQKRRGPNVVGPFGLFQSLADALKYMFKEIIIPASANKIIFILAPIVTMTLALISWAVIPFSEDFVLASNKSQSSVVFIQTLNEYEYRTGSWLDWFFEPRNSQQIGSGSGVILSKDGYIVPYLQNSNTFVVFGYHYLPYLIQNT